MSKMRLAIIGLSVLVLEIFLSSLVSYPVLETIILTSICIVGLMLLSKEGDK